MNHWQRDTEKHARLLRKKEFQARLMSVVDVALQALEAGTLAALTPASSTSWPLWPGEARRGVTRHTAKAKSARDWISCFRPGFVLNCYQLLSTVINCFQLVSTITRYLIPGKPFGTRVTYSDKAVPDIMLTFLRYPSGHRYNHHLELPSGPKWSLYYPYSGTILLITNSTWYHITINALINFILIFTLILIKVSHLDLDQSITSILIKV